MKRNDLKFLEKASSIFLVLALLVGIFSIPGTGSARGVEGGDINQTALVEPQEEEHGGLMSFKTASRYMVHTGDTFRYAIHLQNNYMNGIAVDVEDALPHGVEYIPGSATEGGQYDPATRQLTWRNMQLTQGQTLQLTFGVTATMVVSAPVMIMNTALVEHNGVTYQRQARVMLYPGSPNPASSLAASYKKPSQHILPLGEVVTYTIQLLNQKDTEVIADVGDPIPEELIYIEDSASGGGVYDTATRTLSWSGIAVPANGATELTFAATNAITVTRPQPVMNVAAITAEGVTLERRAFIQLVPKLPWQRSDLRGSHKTASQCTLAPGEVLTYTIHLHNSNRAPVIVDVTDPLPSELALVAGTITGGGTYDEVTRTITWSGLEVARGHGLRLTFAVEPALEVITPTQVVNTATIVSPKETLERSARTLLVPASTQEDDIAPVVQSLIVAEQDVLVDPQVTLHISATDNVDVRWMFVKEWYLDTDPAPHWKVQKSSGWIDFQADYPWTLASTNGVHYVGVWVADSALNRSHLTREGMDFASLVLPDANIGAYRMIPYLVAYPAGLDVNATVIPTSGDVDLYVWYPGNFGLPDQASIHPGTVEESVIFTTTTPGPYLFLIFSHEPSVYNLTITPAGGPSLPLETSISLTAPLPAANPLLGEGGDLTSEPLLSFSGVDPLGSTDDPMGPFVVFLPKISR